MDMATAMRGMALRIDEIVKPRRAKKNLDEWGEPTFSFDAKVPIPKDFRVTSVMFNYAKSKGFEEKAIRDLETHFKDYYAKTGTKWMSWSSVWRDWVRREAERKKGQAGPAVTPKSYQAF
jgi:hypothetical protein